MQDNAETEPAPSAAGDNPLQARNGVMLPLPPKPRPQVYAYHHSDTATTREELEEFFSYSGAFPPCLRYYANLTLRVELPDAVQAAREAWSKSWPDAQEWHSALPSVQRKHIQSLLERLEHKDAEERFQAARSLCYIAQGTPHETDSIEDHLRRVLMNCMALRSAGALQAVYDALRSAGGRWTIVSDSTMLEELGGGGHSPPRSPGWPKLEERQEYLDELNAELGLYLNVLYFMVELSRGDDEWAEELMTLDPPLPIYLFDLVAGLREKNAKGYPVKKVRSVRSSPAG
jgi:hypothetical protein